jgi:hypothetical protein
VAKQVASVLEQMASCMVPTGMPTGETMASSRADMWASKCGKLNEVGMESDGFNKCVRLVSYVQNFISYVGMPQGSGGAICT